MKYLLTILATLLGPFIYFLVSFKDSPASSYEEYHFGSRHIPLEQFIDTTVAYALQVAVITLFATWGFLYGFWALWVPIFWGAGYYLIAYLVKRGRLDSFLLQENIGTIHQFLSQKSKLRSVGALAALVSLLGTSGPAMFEAQYTGKTVAHLFAYSINSPGQESIFQSYSTLFFVSFLIIAAIYMLYGGFRAVVRTDVVQLGIGYIGFNIVLSLLLFKLSKNNHYLFSLLALLALTLMSGWLTFYYKSAVNQGSSLKRFIKNAFPLLFSFFIYLSTLLMVALTPTGMKGGMSIWKILEEQKFFKPLSLGVIPLLSLLIANGLYQVVDIGQWQRLAAVQAPDIELARNKLSKAIKVIMLYSSASWVIAIIFGMAIKYATPFISTDPYDAVILFVQDLFNSGDDLNIAIVFFFILSMVAIMFSTLDSLISCIAFTIQNDWLIQIKRKLKTIFYGRATTIIYLIVVFILYNWLSNKVQNFSDILYSCWAYQIALFPAISLSFINKGINGWFMFFSIIGGMIGASVPLIIGPPLSAYSHAPIFSLIVSSCIIALGVLTKKKLKANLHHIEVAI